MTMVGAQLGELRALVSQLGGPLKAQLDGDLNAMNSKVQASASYWTGNNANKFRSDFASFVKQTNVGLNRVLEEASKVSGQNLNAIEAATGSHA
jgi:uncharacterized protein YukE